MTVQTPGFVQRSLLVDTNGNPLVSLPVSIDLSETDIASETTQLGNATLLADILAKLIAAPATSTKQDTGNTSLASILTKIIAAPATEAKQDTGNTSLSTIAAKDFSTQTTLAAVLAKLTSDPATQTTLAAILAKIIAAPATEAKQDTGNTSLGSILTSVDGVEGQLASLLAKFGTLGQQTSGNSVSTVASSSEVGASSRSTQGAAAHDAAMVGNPLPLAGSASATAPTDVSTNGDVVKLWALLNGALAMYQAYGMNRVDDEIAIAPSSSMLLANTTAYATNLVVKASAGKLQHLSIYNSKGSAQFIQLHNSASLPADTAVPVDVWTIATAATLELDFGMGIPLSTGIVICNSSTGPTKTIGSADIWVTAMYV